MNFSLGHLVLAVLFIGTARAADPGTPDFSSHVAPILTKYCAGCHNATDREGKLSLQSFADLQMGGESGPVVLPGQADSSRMIRVLTGASEPAMPPEGEAAPAEHELAILKAWINAGAKGPQGAEMDRKRLITPQVPAASGASQRTDSLAYSPTGTRLAVGRFGSVDLRDAASGQSLQILQGLPGKVNAVHFSSDGRQLVTASGVSGLYGLATLWNVETGERMRDFEGHTDTLYDAELSPEGRLLATCGYDRRITIWDAHSGAKIRQLDGHNDAIYDLAFAPDGKVLASVSGDKTVKIWNVATGERLDTLSQPLGEQYVVTFSPDGQFVLAGGADNRIRVWEFVSRDKPRINPLRYARFAHEGAVVALAFSPDGQYLLSAAEDQTVKRWETKSYTERELYERQPDLVVDLAVPPAGEQFSVARADGSLGNYRWRKSAAPVATTPAAVDVAAVGREPMPLAEADEHEPNDRSTEAMAVAAPIKVRGKVAGRNEKGVADVDLFRFTAQAGQEWMIEVNAARQKPKSALDSKVEILDAQGQPVPRVLLQAIRDSYFTFRGKDSDTSDDFRVFNWQEMEPNELLYANGEVVKLWHYPRGPDSGFIVYPGRGKRWTMFDTTPVSHALGEPCYIVEPHPPGTSLIPNGLPTFTLYYENDDDSWRQWDSDSRLSFVAPGDGEYLVRVTDARGFEGSDYRYELLIRPRNPDFALTVGGKDPTAHAGSGKEFSIQVERLDAFDGEIRIDVEGLPPGFHASTPLLVEQNQTQVLGVITAEPDAPKPTAEQAKASRLIASAMIRGQLVRKEVGTLGEIKLADPPKLLVRMLPSREPTGGELTSPEQIPGSIPWRKPLELIIRPGQTITAKVKIERNQFNERVAFGNFDAGRNLPHGVFVDNIGLNGLMIVEGQSERIFFITAAPWVPDQTRMFHLQAQADGNQTSWPVILRVQRDSPLAAGR